jgi:hypothetical protein
MSPIEEGKGGMMEIKSATNTERRDCKEGINPIRFLPQKGCGDGGYEEGVEEVDRVDVMSRSTNPYPELFCLPTLHSNEEGNGKCASTHNDR